MNLKLISFVKNGQHENVPNKYNDLQLSVCYKELNMLDNAIFFKKMEEFPGNLFNLREDSKKIFFFHFFST